VVVDTVCEPPLAVVGNENEHAPEVAGPAEHGGAVQLVVALTHPPLLQVAL
jgi:hypothetical protein